MDSIFEAIAWAFSEILWLRPWGRRIVIAVIVLIGIIATAVFLHYALGIS